jgi:glycosyltransferase involved in cell wall biosynthesis
MTSSDSPRLSIAMMIESVGLGGAEMVVLQLAEELRSRGHAVHPVIPLGPAGWLGGALVSNGFEPVRYSGRGMLNRVLVRDLTLALRARGVNAIHSHEFVMAYYGTFVARRLGCPHVITLHADQHMTARWHKRVALRWSFRNSDAVVAVSKHTGAHLEERLALRAGAVKVVPNGIPSGAGNGALVRAEFGIRPDERMVLAVGSLVARKGHALLIDALARLEAARSVPPWRLLIAGEGVERGRLEAQAGAAGLADRVHLLGHRHDGANLRDAADVFAMPSLWEGMPLAVLEAMFARRAIVASATSGIPETLTNDVDALLVEPGSVDELATALRRLLGDEALRRRLGDAALARAEREFTIGAMTDAYERLYRSRASDSQPRSPASL